jgi:hypothetical protein
LFSLFGNMMKGRQMATHRKNVKPHSERKSFGGAQVWKDTKKAKNASRGLQIYVNGKWENR